MNTLRETLPWDALISSGIISGVSLIMSQDTQERIAISHVSNSQSEIRAKLLVLKQWFIVQWRFCAKITEAIDHVVRYHWSSSRAEGWTGWGETRRGGLCRRPNADWEGTKRLSSLLCIDWEANSADCGGEGAVFYSPQSACHYCKGPS